ncbi:MAG: hypothetical protein IJF54_05545 [Clostridia bacterium]|nr:hypothetical protein [Clostridia bacterium]
MKRSYLPLCIISLFLALCLAVSGVYALWIYYAPTKTQEQDVPITTNDFRYGTLYITEVSLQGGDYDRANVTKVSDVNICADLALKSSRSSTVTVAVTFYNSTDVSYYYNKTETVATDNERIGYTVSGIQQKDEVPPKTFKTVYVTFAYDGSNMSNRSLYSTLHFNFVVDKDSIGTIVAQTAVDRFRDILNNKVFNDSYQTLENAMNDRSGFNKASAVTYIGNVSGSSSEDSQVIQTLFGQEFMSMDLDGDGKAEPITMMIKRENLDNDNSTGDSYSYSSWGRNYTVNGVEMTLYITSENLNNVSSGKEVVVYAAAFTKPAGASEWTDLVPLTKGTADANNYGGYGSANSFNTDTWVSDSGKTMRQLVQEN